MKIGIFIHSKTGNTKAVAQNIKEKFESLGHTAIIEMVTAVNDGEIAERIQLKDIPCIDGYDIVIFGAPVRGFSLSPVMVSFLNQIKSLKSIKTAVFVTQAFAFKPLGGNQSIKQFICICETKDGNVYDKGIINWSNKKRNAMIDDLVENISKI